MAFRSITLYGAALDRVLNDEGQPVGRHLARVGGYVTREAKHLADTRLRPAEGPRLLGADKRYRDSFRTTTQRESGGLRTRVTNTAPHSVWIEQGTAPHVIVPRRAQVLAFVVAGNGKAGLMVFTKRVQHPGTRAYRILEDALRIGIAKSR